MKAKIILVSLSFVLSSIFDLAYADPMGDFILSRNEKRILSVRATANPPKPIKYVRVTYFVDKFWNEKLADHNFQRRDEHICTKTVSIPAYDPAVNWFDEQEFFDTCEATLDSLKQGITYKATIHLGGLLFIDPKKDNEKNFVPEVNIELTPNNTTDASILMVGQVRGKFSEILTHLHDFSGTFYQDQKIYVGVHLQDIN